MKKTYIISRTSDRSEIQPPCEWAYKFNAKLRKDIRTFKDHDEWEKKFPKDFDRKIIEKGITTEWYPFVIIEDQKDFWLIDIEDIHEFIKKEWSIIINRDEDYIYPELEYSIEIYDYYRE